MDSGLRGVTISRLLKEEAKLTSKGLGFARKGSDYEQRPWHKRRGLAQHQRSGRAPQPHQRKAASAAAVQARPELARRLFQTPFQIDLRPLLFRSSLALRDESSKYGIKP